jgi:hypothetical protein
MWRKIKSKNGITGIGALLLSIASFTAQFMFAPEGTRLMWWSPLGASTAILFILGVILIFWSILKHEKHLSYQDMKALESQREGYLFPLKSVIKERLSRIVYLMQLAGELPLDEYKKKYAPELKTMPMLGTWTWIFLNMHFMTDNLYYESLKENDKTYRKLVQDYKFLYIQITDRKLKKQLNNFWAFEHQYHSIIIFDLFSKNNPDIAKTSHGLRTARTGEKFGEKGFNSQLDKVINRIDQLLNIEDGE